MTVNIDEVWSDFGMDGLEEQLEKFFPESAVDLEEILSKIFSGDVLGGIVSIFRMVTGDLGNTLTSMKNVFIWILVLGIVATLITQFVDIFDNHMIADIGFYFTYLLMTAVLMKSFVNIAETAAKAMENIIHFIQIFIPAFFLSVGLAAGSTTAVAGYELILILIYLVEHVLHLLILPMVYSYVMLSFVNGIWTEDKLVLVVEGMEKIIRFLLKGLLGVVTGVSALQSMITPAIDSVKSTALQKTIAAIPGVGDMADGVMDVVIGSAVVIKNGIGIVFLLFLLAVSAAPLLMILFQTILFKVAAALLGIVSDKRITTCTDKIGTGSKLLFDAVGTSVLMFLIVISVAVYSTNRGY